MDLVRSFDTDLLAGQSFVLLPVTSGTAKDLATALQTAFRSQTGGALSDLVRVLPMDHIDAVLVVAGQPRYIDDVKRAYVLIERNRQNTLRNWQVYYLQNSHADDIAYVLQEAFTPNNITAQPSVGPRTAPMGSVTGMNGVAGGQTIGAGGGAGGPGGGALLPGSGMQQTGTAATGVSGGTTGQGGPGLPLAGPSTLAAATNPLLGGLDQSAAGGVTPDAMRIIPNAQNNAVLVYGTGQEQDTVAAMLHKIDILPRQVRIDATIAEVTLNDALQYGTQFFFRSGGLNGVLSSASQALTTGGLATATFETNFPGFVIGGNGSGGAPFAISALQAVTKVDFVRPGSDGVGRSACQPPGRQSGAVSDADLTERGHVRGTGDQFDQLPRDRRDHASDAAGEQRWFGDTRHFAGGQCPRYVSATDDRAEFTDIFGPLGDLARGRSGRPDDRACWVDQ